MKLRTGNLENRDMDISFFVACNVSEFPHESVNMKGIRWDK